MTTQITKVSYIVTDEVTTTVINKKTQELQDKTIKLHRSFDIAEGWKITANPKSPNYHWAMQFQNSDPVVCESFARAMLHITKIAIESPMHYGKVENNDRSSWRWNTEILSCPSRR